MVAKPSVVNRHGLINTSQGFGRPYIAIVLHIAGGQLAGADSWFNNPEAETRVNYMVGWNGAIHEYYDPASNVRGYQHGKVKGNTSAKFKTLQAMAGWEHNPNTWAVGIEHEDFQQGDVSRQFRDHPAMFEASTSLSAWLCERFGIPADVDHFLCHAEIDAINRVCCPMCAPGRDAMVAAYVKRVREKLGQEEDLATPEALLEAARAMNRAQLGELNNILQQGPISIVGAPDKATAPTLYAPSTTQQHNKDDITRGQMDHWLKDLALAGPSGGDDPDHKHPLEDHKHEPGGVST